MERGSINALRRWKKDTKVDAFKWYQRMIKTVISNQNCDHVCFDTNMGKILLFKTLTSQKRGLCLFGDQNWQDFHFCKSLSPLMPCPPLSQIR